MASTAATEIYLPAYQEALHERRLDLVVTALDRLRDDCNTVASIRDHGLAGDGTALAGRARAEVNRAFAERGWPTRPPCSTSAAPRSPTVPPTPRSWRG